MKNYTDSDLISMSDFKVKNEELTQQANNIAIIISEMEATIEQSNREQKIHSKASAIKTTEFSDGMMTFVKSIRVFDATNAIVDIDVSGVVTNSQNFYK